MVPPAGEAGSAGGKGGPAPAVRTIRPPPLSKPERTLYKCYEFVTVPYAVSPARSFAGQATSVLAARNSPAGHADSAITTLFAGQYLVSAQRREAARARLHRGWVGG